MWATNAKWVALATHFALSRVIIVFEPTQARKGLKGFAPAETAKSVHADAQTEVQNPVTPTMASVLTAFEML